MAGDALTTHSKTSLVRRRPPGLQPENVPRWKFSAGARQLRNFWRLRRRLAELVTAAANCGNIGQVFDEVQGFPEFRSEQKRQEFVGLLELLAEKPPRYLCEIGSRR